jgi:hypothetical protein
MLYKENSQDIVLPTWKVTAVFLEQFVTFRIAVKYRIRTLLRKIRNESITSQPPGRKLPSILRFFPSPLCSAVLPLTPEPSLEP